MGAFSVQAGVFLILNADGGFWRGMYTPGGAAMVAAAGGSINKAQQYGKGRTCSAHDLVLETARSCKRGAAPYVKARLIEWGATQRLAAQRSSES